VRAGRRREHDEEGVSLGVDLDTVVARAGVADRLSVRAERLGVPLRAELAKQPCRPLDVREEEGDRAAGEIRPHTEIMLDATIGAW
jgi:hypothetical protein